MLAYRPLQGAAQKAEDWRQVHLDNNLFVMNFDRTCNPLTSGGDGQPHPVFIEPIRFYRGHAGGKVSGNLMRVFLQAATHFFAAQLMRKGDAHQPYRDCFVGVAEKSGSGTPVSGEFAKSSSISSPP